MIVAIVKGMFLQGGCTRLTKSSGNQVIPKNTHTFFSFLANVFSKYSSFIYTTSVVHKTRAEKYIIITHTAHIVSFNACDIVMRLNPTAIICGITKYTIAFSFANMPIMAQVSHKNTLYGLRRRR